MNYEKFQLTDSYGTKIQCFRWTCNSKPLAVLQIVHGMAEHATRYDDFATFLVKNNIAIYANDHRGHGLTAGTVDNTGFFADNNGWEVVTDNVYLLTEQIKKDNPDIPVYILGHSMGSLIARTFMAKYPDAVNGIILSGTSYNPSLLLSFGKLVANIQRMFAGKKHRSKLLDTLSFGKFNNKFKPARTKFDWLSRDEKQVDNYINDPYCGFICTASFYRDLFKGILNIQKKSTIEKYKKDLPLLIISGEMDAVGNFTFGVQKICNIIKSSGIKDIELKFYKDSRHEILNEINNKEVYIDILNWLNNKFYSNGTN